MSISPKQARKWHEQLVQLISMDAMRRFDVISPVRRVVVKLNPAKYGEFVFMAILSNEQRYEGRTLPPGERGFDWCLTPNCNCIGVIALKSPMEAGVTIDD